MTLRGKRGPNGKPIVLIESVKQDRRKHITRFEQEFVEGRGKSATRKKFSIAFRTLSVPQMVQRLEKAGFEVAALLGDYQGGAVGPARRRVDHPCARERRGRGRMEVMFRSIGRGRTSRRRSCVGAGAIRVRAARRHRHRRLDLSCELAAPGRALPLLDAAGRRNVRPRPRGAAPADAGRAAPQRSARRRSRHRFLDRPLRAPERNRQNRILTGTVSPYGPRHILPTEDAPERRHGHRCPVRGVRIDIDQCGPSPVPQTCR